MDEDAEEERLVVHVGIAGPVHAARQDENDAEVELAEAEGLAEPAGAAADPPVPGAVAVQNSSLITGTTLSTLVWNTLIELNPPGETSLSRVPLGGGCGSVQFWKWMGPKASASP